MTALDCPFELRSAIVIPCGAIQRGNLDGAWLWYSGGLRPPAHPSTHRLGPLRGRLGPQPQTFRAGRPACLVGLAFAAGPLRAPFGRLGVGLPACGARPPLRVGSLREARRAACGHPCRQAGTVLRRLASPPFGSHRHHVTATPLRCVSMPRRGSTHCAPCTQLSQRFGLSATPLGRGLQSGGRAPWALADRAPPPLGVGRWGALKPTTLRCRFFPGGSPVRSRPFGCIFGGGVETLASLPSTCPTHVLAVTPFGRSAMTARLPLGRRFASPQSALESYGLRRQGRGTLEENG